MKTENISLSNNDKLILLSNLSTMLTAGIPLLETVDAMLEDSKGNQKKFLEVLREDLMQGKHIYFTLSKFPNVFTKVTTNIIKAAEEAGTLDITLKDVRDGIKKDIEFTDKIKSALTYPLFVVFVFFLVLLMILTVVVPKISDVFSRLGVNLPLPTKILIYASNMLLQHTILVAAGAFLLLIMMFFLYKIKKKTILNILFGLPLLSGLTRDIDLTRFSRSLFLLLNAGIPIAGALELTEEVVLRNEVAKAIQYTREMAVGGKRISEGLKTKRSLFPSIMIRITEAGEKSGTLDKSMQEISEFLDYQVTSKLKTITVLLEPIMLVLVGGVIGGMMLAIITPIYGLISQVGVGR